MSAIGWLKRKYYIPRWMVLIVILCIVGLFWLMESMADRRSLYFSQVLQEKLPLSDDFNTKNNWYDETRVIAHAGGAINGNIYTNSLEAIENSYYKGFHVVEVDLRLTKDGEIVLKHSWKDDMYDGFSEENIPSKNEFLSTPIKYIYTPLSLDEFVIYLKKRPGLTAVGHLQNYDLKELEIVAEKIKELCNENKNELSNIWFMLRRPDGMDSKTYENLIDQFDKIVNVNWIYFVWENDELNYIQNNDIKVVMITSKSDIDIKLFRDSNIAVYYYSTDEIRECIEIMESGCNGFFTNFLDEKTLKEIVKVQN